MLLYYTENITSGFWAFIKKIASLGAYQSKESPYYEYKAFYLLILLFGVTIMNNLSLIILHFKEIMEWD